MSVITVKSQEVVLDIRLLKHLYARGPMVRAAVTSWNQFSQIQ